jgi:hypothetical protein
VEDLGVFYFGGDFFYIFDLISESFLDEVDLFSFDILAQHVDKFHFILCGIAVDVVFHGGEDRGVLVGHAVSEIEDRLHVLDELLSLGRIFLIFLCKYGS